jgi:hypothetical protein
MFTEAKARLAGQVAAADAISEYADMLQARDVACMFRRVELTQRTRRTAKAVH